MPALPWTRHSDPPVSGTGPHGTASPRTEPAPGFRDCASDFRAETPATYSKAGAEPEETVLQGGAQRAKQAPDDVLEGADPEGNAHLPTGRRPLAPIREAALKTRRTELGTLVQFASPSHRENNSPAIQLSYFRAHTQSARRGLERGACTRIHSGALCQTWGQRHPGSPGRVMGNKR